MSKASIEVEGYVAADVTLKFTESGKAVLNFDVPHTARRRNQSGDFENVGDTLWVRVSLWGDEAELFAPLLTKGTRVVVSGVPELRLWESGEKHGADLTVKFARVAIIPSTSERSLNTPPSADSGWNPPAASSDGVGGDWNAETPF